MAFWGVEVKPGKPFTLAPCNGRRLHVSQATLGTGNATKKSMVQCNVGDRRPVCICSLFPEKFESLQLHLEFEETVEVVFSVVGPQSVHLTGYYLGGGRQYDSDDRTESYGEDIADTEAERSADGSDEDDFEDSFINDDDLEVILPSPVSSVGVEEILEKRKPEKGKGSNRRLRKKYQGCESGDDCVSQRKSFENVTASVTLLDSESEDALPISLVRKSGSTAKSTKAEAKEHKAKKSQGKSLEEQHEAGGEDDFFFGKVFKWDKAQQSETEAVKLDKNLPMINEDDQKSANDIGDNWQHFSLPSTDMVLGNVTKSEKRRIKQAKEEIFLEIREDKAQQDKATAENIGLDIPVAIKEILKQANDEEDKTPQSQDEANADNIGLDVEATNKENQKKTNNEEDKSLQDEANADNVEHDMPLTNKENWSQANDGEDKALQVEANAENEGHNMPLIKKENYRQTNDGDDQVLQDGADTGIEGQALPVTGEENMKQANDKDDKVLQDEANTGNEGQVFPVDEENMKPATDKGVDLPCTLFGTENVANPKRKRKERANREPLKTVSGHQGNAIKEDKGNQDELKSDGMDLDLCVQNEQNQKQPSYVTFDNNVGQSGDENHSDKKRKKKKKKRRTQENREASNMDDQSSQHRTLSNGLVIEELETGKSDGKISAPGKKISIRYTGKLKESGQVFDSNVDGAPIKFRLGKGRALKCWDAGLDGMRVGQKRRLIVPPSLGFGSEGDGGKNVPPDSWLMYDVELLDVK